MIIVQLICRLHDHISDSIDNVGRGMSKQIVQTSENERQNNLKNPWISTYTRQPETWSSRPNIGMGKNNGSAIAITNPPWR